MATVKLARKRADRAFARKRHINRLLEEIYRYVIPYRDVNVEDGGSNYTQGQPRVDEIYEGTPVKAAFRFAGRMQQDLTPQFREFFELEAGSAFAGAAPDVRKGINEELAKVTTAATGVLNAGPYHVASHEMYFDLFSGTGAMLLLDGGPDQVMRPVSVPIPEMALEEGPFGDIWGRHWKRKWFASQLPELWPDGKFSDQLRQEINKEADKKIEICQSTMFNPKTRRHELVVFVSGEDGQSEGAAIWRETFRSSPWITPRFFKVPGEAMGRGPAMLALPFIKTANKTRELTLMAAGFALLGLWMRRNDSVFNPDTARLEPGAMWDVASTGGLLGPTIQRLDIPKDFDVSSIVIADEREQIKQALFDDTLPPDAGAVRSPTEIVERMKRLNQDLGGVMGRLTLEIVQPTVQRVIDLLEQRGELDTNLTIDQLLVQIKVVSPIAATQQADDVQRLVDWLQILQGFLGQEGMMTFARLENAMPDSGRMMGVQEKFIRSAKEAGEVQEKLAQIIAAQSQAAAGEGGEGAA